MSAIMRRINRCRCPVRLFQLAQADYACTHKHLCARDGRIVHKKG